MTLLFRDIRLLFLLIIMPGAICTNSAQAASDPSSPDSINDATADAVVKKLEDSGKLDAALDRAIQRYQAKAEEQARQQQAEQERQAAALAVNSRKPDMTIDHVRGNPNALVSLVEYSDVECPFCKQFQEVPLALVKRFGGKVNAIWRHYPLPFHEPMATREAIAAECASQQGGNRAFWSYLDKMIASTGSNGKGMPGDNPIVALAKSEGLNLEKFNRCLENKEVAERVHLDQEDGTNAGVSGTPTTLIRNNKTGEVLVISGGAPEVEIAAKIAQMLAQPGTARK